MRLLNLTNPVRTKNQRLACVEMLNEGLPDILILDFTMPGTSGLYLLKDIKHIYPKLPILILSIHPPERIAIPGIKSEQMDLYENQVSLMNYT